MPASDSSQPMSFGIDPSLRSPCKVAVFWNHRWLRLVLTRTWGDRSKSAPAPTKAVPGLLKFDCPSSFDERSELRTPLRPLIALARPPPAKGSVWPSHLPVSPPQPVGFPEIAPTHPPD